MAIASVFILVFFAVYAGSCFVTCGKLFSKLFGQNYQLMMVVGALFVLLYTFFGGFLAESASDFMQAIVMIIALVLVLTLGVFAAGGFHAVLENARQIPGFFDFFFTATPQVDANGVQQLTAAGQPFFGDAQPYPCSPFSQSLPGALATSVWSLRWMKTASSLRSCRLRGPALAPRSARWCSSPCSGSAPPAPVPSPV